MSKLVEVGGAVRDSRWMLLSFGLSLVLQAGYFILLARMLGPTDFGLFSAGLALCTVLGCLGGLGAGNALLQFVSRSPSLAGSAWRNALVINLCTIVPLALVALLLLAPLSAPWWMALVLAMTDILMVRVVDSGMQLRQARAELRSAAAINVGLSAAKLAAAGIGALLGLGLEGWLLAYAATMGTIGLGVAIASRAVLAPEGDNVALRLSLLTGLPFSLGMASRSLHVDADKYLMSALSTNTEAGQYAVGSRLLTMAFIPIQAIAYSANRDLFIAGASGLTGAWERGKHLLRLSVGISSLAAVCLALAAPLVPLVMGSAYEESVELIRVLSPVLVLQAIYTIIGDVLMGAGRQWLRSLMQFSVGIGVVCLNIFMIPRWGAYGAAFTALAGGLALCVALAVALRLGLKAEPQRPS